MDPLTVQDLDEMAQCVAHSLWTAAAVMAFRVFEETIRTHVSEDLKVPIKNLTLQAAITHLKRSFSKEFTQQIDQLRKLRNLVMHPEERLSKAQTMKIIELTLWLTIYVYSIPQED